MRVAFRVDASEEIGTGHLMRCLTLADELKRRGVYSRFVCRKITPFLAAKLAAANHALVTFMQGNDLTINDLAHSHWLKTSQIQDAEDTAAALLDGPWDWLVVDHYALDARWEKALRPFVAKILALDDLADRPHDCDALLDQNLKISSASRYDGLVPQSCRRFEGAPYALLRPEFRDAVARKPAKAPGLPRLNVFFGGTDPNGMTLAALEAIASLRSRTFAVDLVVGNDNPRRDELERRCAALADVKLHVQPPGMAALFAQATLALGAAGSTSWERCCLGLPTVLVSIADNQKSGAAALGFARAAIDLGSMSAVPGRLLASMLETLIRRPRLLRYMGLRASMLVDGKGTERIAEMMECA